MRIGAWLAFAILMLVVLPPLATVSEAKSYSIETSFTIRPGMLSVKKVGSHILPFSADMVYLREPGKPLIPYRRLLVALPPGAGRPVLECHAHDERLLILPGPIARSQPPAGPRGPIEARVTVKYPYPSRCVSLLGVHIFRGVPIAVIHVYPVQALNDTALRVADIDLKVQVRAADTGQPPRTAEAPAILWKIVDNPYDLDLWGYTQATTESYVVLLASEDMKEAVEPLLRLRAARGFSTHVYTLGEIEASYPGNTTQERIRAFARNISTALNAAYLVLAGDVPLIPTQYFHAQESFASWSETGDKATDLYYALLDGSWDPNGNGLLLESLDGDGDNYPEINKEPLPDVAADIYVGRIPADNTSHLSSIVNRIVGRETNPPNTGWDRRMVFLAAILNYANEDGKGWPKTDAATVAEHVISDMLPGYMEYMRAYEDEGLSPSQYPHEYALNISSTSSLLSEGAAYLFSAAHGSQNAHYRKIWAVDDGDDVPEAGEMSWQYFIASYSDLEDGGGGLIGYLDACLSGWYDYRDGLAEALINVGAVGIVASSRISYYHVGWSDPLTGAYDQELHYLFWKEVLGGEALTLGEALYLSKLDYAVMLDVNSEYASKKDFLVYNLLGDPGARIRFNASRKPVIRLAVLPGRMLLVNVSDQSGQPMQDMLVTVMTANATVLARGYTSSSGAVSFVLTSAAMGSNETLYVSASGNDTLVGFAEINATQLGSNTTAMLEAHIAGDGQAAPVNSTARIYVYFTVNGSIIDVDGLDVAVIPEHAYVGQGIISTPLGTIYYVDVKLSTPGTALIVVRGAMGAYNASIVAAKEFTEPPATRRDVENVYLALKNLNATLIGVENGVASLNTSLGMIEARLEELGAQISGLSEHGVLIETKLGQITAGLGALNATLIGLAGEVAVINTSLGLIVLGVNNTYEAIQAVSAMLGSLNASYAAIDAKLSLLAPRVEGVKGDTAYIRTRIGLIEASLTSLDARLKGIKNNIAIIETRLGAINASLTDLGARIDKVEGDLVLISTVLGRLRTNISSLRGDTDRLRADLANSTLILHTMLGDIYSGLGALNATLIGLEARVDNNTAYIVARFNTSLGLVEARLTSLGSTVATQESLSRLALKVDETSDTLNRTMYLAAAAAVLAALATMAALLRRGK